MSGCARSKHLGDRACRCYTLLHMGLIGKSTKNLFFSTFPLRHHSLAVDVGHPPSWHTALAAVCCADPGTSWIVPTRQADIAARGETKGTVSIVHKSCLTCTDQPGGTLYQKTMQTCQQDKALRLTQNLNAGNAIWLLGE